MEAKASQADAEYQRNMQQMRSEIDNWKKEYLRSNEIRKELHNQLVQSDGTVRVVACIRNPSELGYKAPLDDRSNSTPEILKLSDTSLELQIPGKISKTGQSLTKYVYGNV